MGAGPIHKFQSRPAGTGCEATGVAAGVGGAWAAVFWVGALVLAATPWLERKAWMGRGVGAVAAGACAGEDIGPGVDAGFPAPCGICVADAGDEFGPAAERRASAWRRLRVNWA